MSRPPPGTALPCPAGILYRWAEDGSGVLTVEWYDRTVILTPGKEGAAFRDGVLYAPLRPLAEALGLTVEWTGVVELSYPKRQVYAESLEELFNAVAPDTEIALAQGEYSFGGHGCGGDPQSLCPGGLRRI